MSLVLSEIKRAALTDAAAHERRVRQWRRYQAVLLVADGKRPAEAAASIGCSPASVYAWLARWRGAGVTGLAEAPHPAPIQAHAAPLETLLTTLLADDPQRHGHHATGWTIPLLHGEAAAAGIRMSDHTVRRAVRRLGWRWKRPKYVLGRPDPAYAEKRGDYRSGSSDHRRRWRGLVRGRDDAAGVPAPCGWDGRGAGSKRW